MSKEQDHIFLKLGDIKGGKATAKKFEGQIVLQHFSYSIHQEGDWEKQGESTSPRMATFGDLCCTKVLDATSPQLALSCAMKDQYEKAEIAVLAGTSDAYYKVMLEQVIISSINNTMSAGEAHPTETVTLKFRKMRWEYGTAKLGFDLEKQDKI